MPDWDAELVIDEALVCGLLEEQFPGLDAASARLFGEGWDNSVWVVEEEWAFRFPRRAIAIAGVERELAILPRLAPLLAVSIPVPTFVGQRSDRFPWPFFGSQLIPGREVADASVGDEARVALGTELGRLLHALHEPEMRARVDPDDALPVDLNHRADMDRRVPLARRYLDELDAAGIWQKSSAARLLAGASRLAPRERVFLHGDLHLRHVLVENESVSGIIDWGDACTGDPSIDLQVAWSLLTPEGRQAFFVEYGAVDDAVHSRARVLALSLCAALAAYAHTVGNANLLRESVAGLERTLVD